MSKKLFLFDINNPIIIHNQNITFKFVVITILRIFKKRKKSKLMQHISQDVCDITWFWTLWVIGLLLSEAQLTCGLMVLNIIFIHHEKWRYLGQDGSGLVADKMWESRLRWFVHFKSMHRRPSEEVWEVDTKGPDEVKVGQKGIKESWSGRTWQVFSLPRTWPL